MSCTFLPHGPYTILPTLLAATAWAFSLYQDDCDYVRVTGPIVGKLTHTDKDAAPYLVFGVQGYREPVFLDGTWRLPDSCYTFETAPAESGLRNHKNDLWWYVGDTATFLALVLGGSGAFFLLFSIGCRFSRATWKWAGYGVGMAAICQGMSLLFFVSELCQKNTCHLYGGSTTDIVAAVMWCFAALMILGRYPIPYSHLVSEEGVGEGVFVEEGVSAVEEVFANEEEQQKAREVSEVSQMASGEASTEGGIV